MRRIFIFLICCFSLCLCAFADGEEVDIPPASSSSEPVEVEVSINQLQDRDLVLSDSSQLTSDMELQNVSVLTSVSPVGPSDTSGLKSVLLSFLGDYDPVIVEYEYQSSNGYTSYLREVQPDYVWMGSFLLLSLFVFCLFRLGGSLWRR